MAVTCSFSNGNLAVVLLLSLKYRGGQGESPASQQHLLRGLKGRVSQPEERHQRQREVDMLSFMRTLLATHVGTKLPSTNPQCSAKVEKDLRLCQENTAQGTGRGPVTTWHSGRQKCPSDAGSLMSPHHKRDEKRKKILRATSPREPSKAH